MRAPCSLDDRKGWIKVTQAKKKNALLVEFTHSLSPVLPALLSRVRDLFDVNARPDIINKHLRKDKILRPLIKANPGTRVPGAFNGFETGLRAILGQQVTVKAATTIACRLVEAFCEPIVTPFPELGYLTPSPAKIAKASVDDLAKHGIVRARCKSIIALAQAHVSGELSLDSGNHHNPNATIERLAELPGIGPWTAHYIAMRALALAGRLSERGYRRPQQSRRRYARNRPRKCRKPGGHGVPMRCCTCGDAALNHYRSKRRKKMNYFYKTMKSPVGELKLVASDKGLAAILWENDKSATRSVGPSFGRQKPSRASRSRTPVEGLFFREAKIIFGRSSISKGPNFRRRFGRRC